MKLCTTYFFDFMTRIVSVPHEYVGNFVYSGSATQGFQLLGFDYGQTAPQKPTWRAYLLRWLSKAVSSTDGALRRKQAVWTLLAPASFLFDNLFVLQNYITYKLSRGIRGSLGEHDFTFKVLG